MTNKDHLAWLPGETKEERRHRLARRSSRKYYSTHTKRSYQASQNWRQRQSSYLGPTRQAVVDYVNDLKNNPCLDCGGSFPLECMDFDHVRGVKVAGISALVGRAKSMELVIAEVAKCELVCANCHRIRTRKRMRASIKKRKSI